MIHSPIVIGPGDILAGKYAVERLLGKGGMGYVFAAHHTQLDQRVAIKVLTPELCEHPGAVTRFIGEARASVRIRGEHVVRVLDVGTGDDEVPFMVMEFLDGRDLSRELEERGPLPVDEAVDCVLQVCEALAEAHALGIVHRDLKPANLFLTQRPDGSRLVKVLDFGISKALPIEGEGEVASVTATQGLIGSPHYMSPEQIRTPKAVDTRSDIWSLGVILFELLAGKPPFAAETPMAILAGVVSDPTPELRAVRDDVSIALEAVVVRCLEKDPRRRYRSVVDLADDLQEFAPRGAEALARITAIARGGRERTSSGPQPVMMRDDGPTLASGSEPPPAPRARPGAEGRTGDGWGNSQSFSGRSRRSLVLVGAAAALFAAGALIFRSPSNSALVVNAGASADASNVVSRMASPSGAAPSDGTSPSSAMPTNGTSRTSPTPTDRTSPGSATLTDRTAPASPTPTDRTSPASAIPSAGTGALPAARSNGTEPAIATGPASPAGATVASANAAQPDAAPHNTAPAALAAASALATAPHTSASMSTKNGAASVSTKVGAAAAARPPRAGADAGVVAPPAAATAPGDPLDGRR